MKVSDLAKEINVSTDDILKTLKSLKLKAKDSNQEISEFVVTVVRSALKKPTAEEKKKEEPAKPKKPAKKTEEKPAKVEKVEKKEEKKEEKKDKPKKLEKEAPKESPKEAPKESKDVKDTRKKPLLKKKISREPLITLKPLLRKRKKQMGRDSREPGFHPEHPPTLAEAAKAMDEKVAGAEASVDEEKKAEWTRDVSLPDLEIKVPITVKELSNKLSQKPSEILKALLNRGIFAHINQGLDGELVNQLAQKFGYNAVKIKTEEEQMIESHESEQEDESLKSVRAPVVTFMGHVDHGKTTLLDRIRKTKVADHEHGGITQHIGAYSVKLPKGSITFLDTPGHEAFTAMRARGAHITDLVVLIVAADEGIMPQTEEAIDHARAANVPIVVALTKIDKIGADLDRVKKQLMEHDLSPEDWGGKTVVAGVSAVTGEGVDNLLELILLEAELLELKANPNKKASGIVVEANLSAGKGAMATLIVQSGTLRDGDVLVVGQYYGKVKAMYDDHGRTIKEAGPSLPVVILGLPAVPEAGEEFYSMEDERQAKGIAYARRDKLKDKRLQTTKVTLEDLYSKLQEGSVKELNVIIKADVQGSLEALKDSLEKIPSSKIKVKFIHMAVGDVNASDVLLALASKAIIIAFHVGIGPKARQELEKEPVEVRQYKIIYDAVDDMRKALEGMLEAKTKKIFISRVEVREVFKLSKQGIVAGCYVQKGKVTRKVKVDVMRDGELVFSGRLASLKRFKDDVREVTESMECGIQIEGFNDYHVGDMFEIFEEEKIAQKL